MLLIRRPETKNYALKRANYNLKGPLVDTLMAEVFVPIKLFQQFQFQTAGDEEPFENFTCQELTEVYQGKEIFYAIVATKDAGSQ